MSALYGLVLLGVIYATESYAEARSEISVNQAELQEVYFSFRYRGVGNVVIMGYYREGDIFLPVGEVFSALLIPNEADLSALSVEGYFLEEDNEYLFNFNSGRVAMGEQSMQMEAEEYIIDELDFFVAPEIFDEIFELEFEVDMSNLMLRLSTPHTMPVVERMEQRRQRERMDQNQLFSENAPLLHDRSRSWIDGGYLDYNLTSNITESPNTYSYNFRAGGELLAGDVQGSAMGTFREGSHVYRLDNLRWRYVHDENPYVTQIRAGQLRTDQFQSRQFNGLRVTNEPVTPRVLYDDYVYEGTASPEAEVEVYLNDRLIAFEEADELGNYRINIPLTYGSSRIRILVYSRDGHVEEFNQRIRVPFTFLPPGDFNYNLSAGMLDNPLSGREEIAPIIEGYAGYGINNQFSARLGMEYIDDPLLSRPLFYGSVSARLATSHLLNLEAAPGNFYRVNAGAYYPNSVSWNADYSWYPERGLYNPLTLDHHLRAGVFLPFELFSRRVYLRMNPEFRQRERFFQVRYHTDMSMRINRLTLRAGLRDSFTQWPQNVVSRNAQSSLSATYNVSGTANFRLLRRLTLRGQARYSHSADALDNIEVLLSRRIGRIGRFRISVNHNLTNEFTRLEAGIRIDFNSVNSNTTALYHQDSYSMRQSIQGSVGYDSYHQDLNFTNRQQVGRSSTTFRMFVDNNDSGSYDEGDMLIEDTAIRSLQSGGRQENDDGLTRINQLQSYKRHNFEINEAAIQNPMLVPEQKEFSVVTDPNQYKPIDIPFYMTGVVEGRVTQVQQGRESAVAGIRVQLEQTDGDFRKELRTFSGGGFYGMEIPPGSYIARVDSSQKKYLEAESEPERYEFKIERTAQGDHVDDLTFILRPEHPEPEPEPEPEEILTPEDIADAIDLILDHRVVMEPECRYRIQISYQATLARAKITKRDAVEEFGVPFHLRYDETYNQFMIFLDYLHDEELAGEALEEIRSERSPDAFIVEECRPFPEDLSYTVAVSGIEKEELLRYFSGYEEYQIQQAELNGETVLEFPDHPELREMAEIYRRVTERFPEAEASIRGEPDVIEVRQQYILRVALYANESAARQRGTFLEQQLDAETRVSYNAATGLYALELAPVEEIVEALELREAIGNFDRFEYPLIRTVMP